MIPATGDLVRVRSRQYLVEGVDLPPKPGDSTRVRLSCIEDDAQGESLEVLWEREVGAREPLRARGPRPAGGADAPDSTTAPGLYLSSVLGYNQNRIVPGDAETVRWWQYGAVAAPAAAPGDPRIGGGPPRAPGMTKPVPGDGDLWNFVPYNSETWNSALSGT